MRSLPDRQLRNVKLLRPDLIHGSLPDRQLRKGKVIEIADELCSLPDRQLRNRSRDGVNNSRMFTAG